MIAGVEQCYHATRAPRPKQREIRAQYLRLLLGVGRMLGVILGKADCFEFIRVVGLFVFQRLKQRCQTQI